jgi:hypothetical protein
MDTRSIVGMMHAEEALLIAILRALPAETRGKVADYFQEQAAVAHTAPSAKAADRDTNEAYQAHLRRLGNLLAALS